VTQAKAAVPYGAWPSPISAQAVASHRVRLNDLQMDGEDILWVEGRPQEQGRCVIVRHADGVSEDILDAPFSARTTVHEYGGGAMLAMNGDVYFANAADRRLYVIAGGNAPRALTPDLGDVRYADMDLDAAHGRLLTIVEDHRGERVVNDIRALPVNGGDPFTIVGGNDFYSNPRSSPDGSRMCWLTWNQPNMPWDGTELWLADVEGGRRPQNARLIAGGARESVFQPSWSPDGALCFVSDRTGWWNLYRYSGDGVEPVAPMEAECGEPQWMFGFSTYAFLADGRVALSVCRDGTWTLEIVTGGGCTPIELPYTDIGGYNVAHGLSIALLAGSADEPMSVVLMNADTGDHRVLRRTSDVTIPDSVLSPATPVTFPGHEGAMAHGFYYEPRNDAVEENATELPPLLVHAHGGPTSATTPALDPAVQYWTSRGFAYLDVNYGGSTGYGRQYRERLRGQEGVVDVGDCVAGALYLAQDGRVDGNRLLIEGGSAGGYIVLCAMTFHDVFAAGASLYGISDLEFLLKDTHKFEARYFDSMVGPYPETRDTYIERSPIHFIDRVRRAVILFQGIDDPIVPANQAEMMYHALREAGIPCAYIAFEGEQHGFRRAGSIVRTLEAELYFFARVLGIDLADDIDPVDVANLERRQTT
jgi:dipeptidyl aminopeptidase/acylaminoacyl peptidase